MLAKTIILICFFSLTLPLKASDKFLLTTTSFNISDYIPAKFTCDSYDLSPALKWSNPPKNTKSFVLIMYDPDAPVGVWDHWILYNISPSIHELPENVDVKKIGAICGKNSWHSNNVRYRGPCPPPGKPHRYFFRLYAVDMSTNFEEGLTKLELQKKIKGHILGKAEFYGLYKR